MATPEEIAAFTPTQAAAWLVAEAPITRAGFGRDLTARLGDLIDAKEGKGRDDAQRDAGDNLPQVLATADAASRVDQIDKLVLVLEDAETLGEDWRVALQRERDGIGGTP